MAASVTGSKTVNNSAAPHLSASLLTTLLATAPENMTVAQVRQLVHALERVPQGGAESKTVGSLLN